MNTGPGHFKIAIYVNANRKVIFISECVKGIETSNGWEIYLEISDNEDVWRHNRYSASLNGAVMAWEINENIT